MEVRVENIPTGELTPHPEERFASYEEADAYAETLGGYCDGLHKIGTKTVWVLLVKR